jgi:hypothetical protein
MVELFFGGSAMKCKSRISISLAICSIIFSLSCQRGGPDKWQSLFDGKTLNGWKVLGGDAEFVVQDGLIVCTTELNVESSFLCTEKSYDNFILEYEVKIDSVLNSGVQIRSHVWESDTTSKYLAGNGELEDIEWPKGTVWGYQIEVDPSERAWSGGFYEEGNRGWLVTLADNPEAGRAFKRNDWNHFKVVANGNRFQTWVNGVPAVDTEDDLTASGFIGLQFHQAYRENQVDKKVFWRDIRIQEL